MSKPIDLRAICEQALDEAAATVIGGGEYIRMIFAGDTKDNLNIICAPSQGEEGEIGMLNYLRAQFLIWDIAYYAMVSEVWISTRPAYSRQSGSMPSEDPNRGEALSAIIVRRVRGESGAPVLIAETMRRVVSRSADAVTVGPTELHKSGVSGRWTMLLPPTMLSEAPEDMKRLALKVLRNLGHQVVSAEKVAKAYRERRGQGADEEPMIADFPERETKQ